MSIAATFLAMQAVTPSAVQPELFYVSGVQQGMTMTDYNALIANGGFKSKPVSPNAFWAVVDGQDIFVSFCQGKVFRAMASYNSVDWTRSLVSLQGLGFKWGVISPVNGSDDKTSALAVPSISPPGFKYSVTPLLKGFVVGKLDSPTFQLSFEALNSPCRAASY